MADFNKARKKWKNRSPWTSDSVVVPSCASEWLRPDAERISIFYKPAESSMSFETDDADADGDCATERWFFKHIGKIRPKDGAWWDRLERYIASSRAMFSEYLDDLNIDRAISNCLFEGIGGFRSGVGAELKVVQDLVEKSIKKLAVSRDKALTSSSPKEYESLGRVQIFLGVLNEILRKAASGMAPMESAFINVFLRYTDLCRLNIIPGVSISRKMKILGTWVSSMPDLQYGRFNSRNEFLVITVAEFKRWRKLSDEFEHENRVTRSQSQESDDGDEDDDIEPSTSKRRKLSKENEGTAAEHYPGYAAPSSSKSNLKKGYRASSGLDTKVCGQHAAELLLELPYSDNKRSDCMFGLIVQATMVHLTCLEMTDRHLRKIQTGTAESLESECATVHYSRGYDLLNRNDREHLDYILLTLAYLSDDLSRL